VAGLLRGLIAHILLVGLPIAASFRFLEKPGTPGTVVTSNV
jgi:hypothetical protein